MHWVLPPQRAKPAKDALEKEGWKPRMRALEGMVHLYLPGIEEAPLAGGERTPCEICSAGGERHADARARPRYSVYPPLVLFSRKVPVAVAEEILAKEKCTHAAINQPIPHTDIVRRPAIQPLIGEFPATESFEEAFWCTCRQNGIFQTWAPQHTMFSRGNITEKKRVLGFAGVAGSTVIDLYCGIGYFTFSYAKLRPAVVYGWEINPWSIEGLRRAARVNNWDCRVIKEGEPYQRRPSDKLVIFEEDNRHALERIPQLDLRNVSHVNMGLLPDCRLAWGTARALATGSTVFHVHENVHERDMAEWERATAGEMGKLLHLERIKQFSPGVWHVCGDFAAPAPAPERAPAPAPERAPAPTPTPTPAHPRTQNSINK